MGGYENIFELEGAEDGQITMAHLSLGHRAKTYNCGKSRDRPRAKALAGIGGARSGRSRVGPTKKRADLGSSCHVGHGSATLVVGPTKIKN